MHLSLHRLEIALVSNLMVENNRQSFLVATDFLVVSTAVRGQETAPSSDEVKSDGDSRIRAIFESVPSNTDEQHPLTVTLNPHFGDLHRYSYLRVPLRIRYDLSDHCEIETEGEGCFSYGVKDSGFGN